MVDTQSEQVMLKLSPLTFSYEMVTCLQSHPPLFDQLRAEKKSPGDRWNLFTKLPSECTNDYSLQRDFILVITLTIAFDDF